MCRCIFCYIFNTIDIYIYCIKYYPVIIKTQVAFIWSLNINLHVNEILKGKAEINQNLVFYSWINNKYKEDKEGIHTTDNCRLMYGRRALTSSVVLYMGAIPYYYVSLKKRPKTYSFKMATVVSQLSTFTNILKFRYSIFYCLLKIK